MNLILASQSPRRKALLAGCGCIFTVKVLQTPEIESGVYFRHIALLNAIRKAEAVALCEPDSLVIGADTVIEFGREVIGKPVDQEDARRILGRLSGKRHQVTTGVSLIGLKANIRISFTETSTLEFKTLTPQVIDDYIAQVHVLDKAGAYNIDEHGDWLVSKVEGPVDNIIGLPCTKLFQAIRTCQMLE